MTSLTVRPELLAALQHVRDALGDCEEHERESMAVIAVGYTVSLALAANADPAKLAQAIVARIGASS
jgi:hypothetical protein